MGQYMFFFFTSELLEFENKEIIKLRLSKNYIE